MHGTPALDKYSWIALYLAQYSRLDTHGLQASVLACRCILIAGRQPSPAGTSLAGMIVSRAINSIQTPLIAAAVVKSNN